MKEGGSGEIRRDRPFFKQFSPLMGVYLRYLGSITPQYIPEVTFLGRICLEPSLEHFSLVLFRFWLSLKIESNFEVVK